MILEKIRWCAVSKFIQLETGSAWFFSSFSRPDTLYYILWNTLHYFNRCTHHKLIKSGSQYFHKFSLLVESPSFLLLVLHMAYNACCKQQSTPLCCVTIQLLSNCLVTIIPLHPSQLQEINIKKIIKNYSVTESNGALMFASKWMVPEVIMLWNKPGTEDQYLMFYM